MTGLCTPAKGSMGCIKQVLRYFVGTACDHYIHRYGRLRCVHANNTHSKSSHKKGPRVKGFRGPPAEKGVSIILESNLPKSRILVQRSAKLPTSVPSEGPGPRAWPSLVYFIIVYYSSIYYKYSTICSFC